MSKRIRAKRFEILFLAAVISFFAATTERRVEAQSDSEPSSKKKTNVAPYDLRYIDAMLAHHQESAEIARLAQKRSRDERVKSLAADYLAKSERSLAELQKHRDELYAGQPSHHKRLVGTGAESSPDMKRLNASDDAAFDQLFLEVLGKRNRKAAKKSEQAATKAAHPAIREHSKRVIIDWLGELKMKDSESTRKRRSADTTQTQSENADNPTPPKKKRMKPSERRTEGQARKRRPQN